MTAASSGSSTYKTIRCASDSRASIAAYRKAARELGEKSTAVVLEVQKIAQETGRSMAQVAINWIRQQPKAQMIPIIGARTAEQLKDNLAVAEWKLSDEQWARLDRAAAIDLGFPHGFLDGNRNVFGATRDLIDNHRV